MQPAGPLITQSFNRSFNYSRNQLAIQPATW